MKVLSTIAAFIHDGNYHSSRSSIHVMMTRLDKCDNFLLPDIHLGLAGNGLINFIIIYELVAEEETILGLRFYIMKMSLSKHGSRPKQVIRATQKSDSLDDQVLWLRHNPNF